MMSFSTFNSNRQTLLKMLFLKTNSHTGQHVWHFSPCLCGAFSVFPGFFPHSKDVHVRLTGDSTLALGEWVFAGCSTGQSRNGQTR